jgi:hypothetical protein
VAVPDGFAALTAGDRTASEQQPAVGRPLIGRTSLKLDSGRMAEAVIATVK